ncbi:MAG: hypothetical protein LC785_09460 [Acidobacteria bacterium]|nr:hypothetical protein [Acidobacteriota bacterium]MCA1642158.1 hypothetical protein [Acidobacteriota bacterium]
MSVSTFEGEVEKGQIKLKAPLDLPDHTKVYVVVPTVKVAGSARIHSPRLAHPKQAARFEMEIEEAPPDAELR